MIMGATGMNSEKLRMKIDSTPLLLVVRDKINYESSIHQDQENELIDLKNNIKGIEIELVYCQANNFTGKVLYPINARAYLRKPVAKALSKVQQQLMRQGQSLKVWDAYRPHSVTKQMWEKVPDERYTANPEKGSGHNRGIAVDLTIIDLKTGEPLDMGTPFDHFSEEAHHSYSNLPEKVLENRNRLRLIMENAGFKALETEWWHYSWEQLYFDILDLNFDVLNASKKQ